MMGEFMDVLRQMVPLLGGVLTATRTWQTHLLSALHMALHSVGFTLQLMVFGSLVLTLLAWSFVALVTTWLYTIMEPIAKKL